MREKSEYFINVSENVPVAKTFVRFVLMARTLEAELCAKMLLFCTP